METGSKRRRRLLHACGVSALTIAHKAYGRAEEVHGPIGSIAHRIAYLTEPIVSPMVSQWLAILSFADDQILSAEDMVEMLIPSSSHVFDKIESFVYIPETLPGKFDCAVDMMIHRVPFLQRAFTLMIWGLNFLLSSFMDWGPDDSAKEKEIMVDVNCNEDEFAPKSDLTHNSPLENEISINDSFPSLPVSAPVAEHEDEVIFKSLMDKSPTPAPPAASDQGGENVKQVKSTYKEVLEMGNNGDAEKKEDTYGKEEHQKPLVKLIVGGERKKPTGAEVGRDELAVNDFPILELFDAGWHMTPATI
ncbi:uncharacterized protein LOC122653969 [Telopea speciosissima]|uniref:uncharacterized protein LOC122653969 n=1 Tax=Telopea speciosissima TaxID=54955 RepID=UPI001CC5215F|nr:uncharacterized protein LOC122653969 [Telopea speciosissima]